VSLAPLFTGTTGLEAQLLLATFLLCSLIGFERQTRQKSAGYRTHVLVGLGSCAFTLVSGYGFAFVLGDDVRLDPSRIAAQVVSGIGFIGAGVIFKGRDVVRGLTTAATIWQAAAVGMACGAGMLSLAIFLTILHLVTLYVVAPLVRRIPTSDRKRFLRITYQDGRGILRDVLSVANSMGFAASIQRTDRVTVDGSECVAMDVRFIGKSAVRDLIPPLMELAGVENISLRDSDDDEEEDAA